MNASEIISVLKSEIADFDRKTGVQEGGTVVRVGDCNRLWDAACHVRRTGGI